MNLQANYIHLKENFPSRRGRDVYAELLELSKIFVDPKTPALELMHKYTGQLARYYTEGDYGYAMVTREKIECLMAEMAAQIGDTRVQ